MLTDQQAKLYAMEIIQYGSFVQQAVQTMLLNGVSENDLSFGNEIYIRHDGDFITPPGHNARCTDNRCEVFHPEGGGITPRLSPKGSTVNIGDSPADWQDGAWRAMTASMDGVGSDARDLVYVAGAVKEQVCRQINQILGIDGSIPVFTRGTYSAYNGIYAAPGTPFSRGVVTKLSAYCFELENRPGTYDYNVVLIAR